MYLKPAHVNSENALLESELFIDSVGDYPGTYEGRGIVICGGGVSYFTNAWVCISMLRHLGCHLPVELWYLGPAEMDYRMKNLMHHLNVECIDGLQVSKRIPVRKLGGWEMKAYALLHSKFEEVLLLDADNVPAANPEYLFESTEYKLDKAIFWPDPYFLDSDRIIWKICGVTYRHEPEFESGQILVNKKDCWKALNLSLWYNEFSDYYYKHIYGDKETFHMAFRKIGKSYHMISKPRISISGVMFQHDPDGKVVFQHRAGAKWRYEGQNVQLKIFKWEKECLNYLDKLRTLWDGTILRSETDSSKVNDFIVAHLTTCIFKYTSVGRDEKLMSFHLNGQIYLGRSRVEQTWNVLEESNTFFLEFWGDGRRNCVLELCADNLWRGHCLDFENQIPIELSPLIASRSGLTKLMNNANASTI